MRELATGTDSNLENLIDINIAYWDNKTNTLGINVQVWACMEHCQVSTLYKAISNEEEYGLKYPQMFTYVNSGVMEVHNEESCCIIPKESVYLLS